MYGVLEKQFGNYFVEANRQSGKTGDNLLRILELRLDNVVFRAGFAKSRDMARQLVNHGHFTVNGKKVDIPSFRVSPNDIIEVKPSSREMTPFVVAHAEVGERTVPAWLEVVPSRCGSSFTRYLSERSSTPLSKNSSSSSCTPSRHHLGLAADRGSSNTRRHIAVVAGRNSHSAHQSTPHPHRGADQR